MGLDLYGALLVLCMPVAFGAWALVEMERFRRVAFGLYRSFTAANMLGLGLGLACYMVIILHFALDGAAVQMTRFPLTLAALLLYVQSVLASATLAAFAVAGRNMGDIARPPGTPGPQGAPRGWL